MAAEFLGSFSVGSERLPKTGKPMVAFLGRSNVGKSSLINLLTNSQIAKVSKTPGRTRALNLFAVEDRWVFGDFPGYGYARVSHQQRAEWEALVRKYLVASLFPFAVQIVDSRHPGQPADLTLQRWLRERGISSIVVVNKVDKLNQSQRVRADRETRKAFPDQPLLFVSTVTKEGKRELVKILHNLTFDNTQRAVLME